MKAIHLEPSGLILLQPEIHSDARGFFLERFQEKKIRDLGIHLDFPQDNHSRSKPGVIRGLHFQIDPPQGKLVGATRGRIWDVVVDLRKSSNTFGKYYSVELNDKNLWMLWVPPGFAHGFCVLGDEDADVFYKVTGTYNPKTEGGLRWNDSQLNIPWPINDPIVSPRDQNLPALSHISPLPF